jgi:hypothetical protein
MELTQNVNYNDKDAIKLNNIKVLEKSVNSKKFKLSLKELICSKYFLRSKNKLIIYEHFEQTINRYVVLKIFLKF